MLQWTTWCHWQGSVYLCTRKLDLPPLAGLLAFAYARTWAGLINILTFNVLLWCSKRWTAACIGEKSVLAQVTSSKRCHERPLSVEATCEHLFSESWIVICFLYNIIVVVNTKSESRECRDGKLEQGTASACVRAFAEANIKMSTNSKEAVEQAIFGSDSE